ncbi:MAG: YkgJ family cysteine cluster protein [Myxococcota bacterium]|nr:YkgJ family cysteine cluster protein [Myxococcota bacterium]
MADEDDSNGNAETELARALVYVHERLGHGLLEHQELSAHVYALTESLIAAGVVTLEDIEERRARAREQMLHSARTHWQGAEVLHDESDKYAHRGNDIDCAARIHLCKAACCRLDFTLSKQDLDEGVVRWDVGRPYHIRQRKDGWCTHCDESTKACGVHAQRPLVCRQYDCRGDARIWADFEKRIPSRKLTVLR